MNKKILILGANGLIGNGLTHYFSSKNLNLFTAVRSKKKEFFYKNKKYSYYKNLKTKKSLIAIKKIIDTIKPNYVINCIGITKHLKKSKNKLLNIDLPKFLSKQKNKYKFTFIHITTDCVFDGKTGNYKENSRTSSKDKYGFSKAVADKFLLNKKQIIILRTSTIGREIKTQHGLLDWFLSRKKTCFGFKNAYFSGLTTLELAKIIYKFIINKNVIKQGIYNLAGPKISKNDLLNIIKKIYNKRILIIPNYQLKIDRTLNSDKFTKISKYKKKSWKKMLLEYKKFYD